MAYRLYRRFYACDTFEEVQTLRPISPSTAMVLCLEEGRECFYRWKPSANAWVRVAGKFTTLDPSSPLDMTSGVLTFHTDALQDFFAPLAVADEVVKATFRTVEIDVGTYPRDAGHFDIAGLSGLTPGNAARVFQVGGPYTNKSPLGDDPEFDSLQVAAICFDPATIRCWWQANGPVSGNFKFTYRT